MKNFILIFLCAFAATAQTIYKPIYNGLLQSDLYANGKNITNVNQFHGGAIFGNGAGITNLSAANISAGVLQTSSIPPQVMFTNSAYDLGLGWGQVPTTSLDNTTNLLKAGGGITLTRAGRTNTIAGNVMAAGSGITIVKNTSGTDGTVTNIISAGVSGQQVNYMLQAQTNFNTTTLFGNANAYTLFTNANGASASGTIELIVTNFASQPAYPSVVFDYIIVPDVPPLIIQRSYVSQGLGITFRVTIDGISKSKLDVMFDDSAYTVLVKFYGQNCFGGGYFSSASNSPSLGTDYTYTPLQTAEVHSGGANFDGDVSSTGSFTRPSDGGDVSLLGASGGNVNITSLAGNISVDSSGGGGGSITLNSGAMASSYTASAHNFTGPITGDGSQLTLNTNVALLNATQKFTGAITATNSGNNITALATNTFNTNAAVLTTLYTNISRSGTWYLDLAFTDAVAGTPSATITINQGSVTNVFVRSPLILGVAGIATNGWSFPLNAGAIYKVQDSSSGTGASVAVKQSVVVNN